jgi:hypothetical protein
MRPLPRRTLLAGGAVATAVVVLVVGSLLYWVGEGRPRSPAAFRELVVASGLDVEWSNNGPRGGDGVVATDCGERVVSVNELDDELWVQWGDQRAPITPAVIDEIVRCDEGSGEDDG